LRVRWTCAEDRHPRPIREQPIERESADEAARVGEQDGSGDDVVTSGVQGIARAVPNVAHGAPPPQYRWIIELLTRAGRRSLVATPGAVLRPLRR
jgi:hypothetical protein